MLSADLVGQALVPYFRQILPMFNLYLTRHVEGGLAWRPAGLRQHLHVDTCSAAR